MSCYLFLEATLWNDPYTLSLLSRNVYINIYTVTTEPIYVYVYNVHKYTHYSMQILGFQHGVLFRGLSLLAKVIVHNCPEVLGFNRSQKPSDSEVFDVVEAQNQGAIVNNYRGQRA